MSDEHLQASHRRAARGPGSRGEARGPTDAASENERNRRWASTMAGHGGPGITFAHADSHARTDGAVVTRARRAPSAPGLDGRARGRRRSWRRGPPGPRRRAPVAARGARPLADLLRAGPRPDPPRHRLPPAGRQDPGVRLPRRPPADPADPRARGGPGRHQRGPGLLASTWRSPRPSPSVTTAGTGPGATPARTPSSPYLDGGFDHAPWGADVSLAPLNLCRRDPRRHPQPLVVPTGALHPRRRGGELGRPDRLCLPRLRGRGEARHRHPGRAARAGPASAAATSGASSSAPSSTPWCPPSSRPGGSAWPTSRPRRWPPSGPATTSTSTSGPARSPRDGRWSRCSRR